MKKTYKSIQTFIVLLSLVAFKMGAQISGVVTINSAAATGGTNYQTFSALATALNTSGINGPLTVNVVAASGPYVEQPIFDAITGVSATNTITINGNGNILQFTSANFSQPSTLLLRGTDRMHINGLEVQALGATYAMGCVLTGGANYNSFTGCKFTTPANATSSSHIPFAISSTSTSASGGTDSGNFNTLTTCTTVSGYYSMFLYGLTSAPYQTDNKVINCLVQDFYQSGIYGSYQKNMTLKGNVIERPNRTNSTTIYGIAAWLNQGAMIDGNRIHRMFDNQLTSTSSFYGIYAYSNSVGGGANRNTIRNNIISDIKHNGPIYGLYVYSLDGDIYHNTISIDHPTSTATGVTYGMYPYGSSGYFNNVKNNIISITRGGTGTKYCNYIALTGNITCDYNDYYIAAPAGANYVGYYGALATNLAAMQALGVDLNSFSVDPMYTSMVAYNYIPTSATINNAGTGVGVPTDIQNNPRSGSAPDIGAHEFLSINCVGTPSANTVVTPTFAICPGENVMATVGSLYSDLGITYQWQSSTTSSVGPFTTISGANSIQLQAQNVTVPTWYSVVMTCANGGGSIQPVGYVNVAGTTTSSVPYFEGFEGITGPNKLPNCSWSATNLGGSTLTYTSSNTLGRAPRTGSKFASFQYLPAGTNYYYTNGIQLEAGVTYSASLWYQTEYYGYNTWTDMSILVNTSQTATGASTIVSSNGPAISNIYRLLSGTFTVATSGIYYVGIKGVSANICCANYLTWDDLAITIPCSLNSPTMAVSVNNTTVCAGDPVSFTANGADTYMWSTNATGSSMNDNPTSTTNYYVVGTSTLSNCSATLTQMVNVNPAPSIYVYADNVTVCAGSPVNLTAFGANTYTWTTGSFASNITVSPTVATSYTVSGSNSFGCSTSAVQSIGVNALPNIAVSSSAPNDMCVGEMQTLTATGTGVSYNWVVSGSGMIMQGNPVTINPTSTTVYTVTTKDVNGCEKSTTISQNVSECVGLKENALTGVKVYPNPTAGEFTVELNNTLNKTIEVTDLAGRVISTSSSNLSVVKVNINNLANGIYYVKIQSETSIEVVKVVKN